MTDNLEKVLPKTSSVIADGIARGLHRGVQLSVSRAGAIVADGAIGTSHEDVPLTADTLLPWLSAGKPLTAVCVLRLIEAGRLTLETRIADVIPEFAATSSAVTLQHLLTHTAGIAPVDTGWPTSSWDEAIDTICRAGLVEGWIPGERAAYDPVRGWFLLGEIVRRLDGRPIEQLLREEIAEPIGMNDTWLAMSARQHRAYGERIGRTCEVAGQRQQPTQLHTLACCLAPSPGSSVRGPIRELRMFYEMLLDGGVTSGGQRLLQPETVRLMTQRHREGMYDETFQHTLDFGLGVIVNSARYGANTVPYGYGRNATDAAFGHGGARSCIAFADPQRQLVVCVVANGTPAEPQHQRRMRQLLAALDEDLQIHQNEAAPNRQ